MVEGRRQRGTLPSFDAARATCGGCALVPHLFGLVIPPALSLPAAGGRSRRDPRDHSCGHAVEGSAFRFSAIVLLAQA
jgi:hypothetical protein